MVKPIQRRRTVSTKVTEEDFQRLEKLACASEQSMSEWVRNALLKQADSKNVQASEEAVLAELLGLRAILLNLLFPMTKGESLTKEQMQTVIERCDAEKLERARKLLSSSTGQVVEKVIEA
jgi:hypothetical protein